MVQAAGFIDWSEVPEERIMDGVRRKVLSTPNMTIVRWVFDAGVYLPLHSHPEEQWSTMISGKGEFEGGGVHRVMCAGDSWMFPSGVPHGTHFLEDTVTIDVFSPPRKDILAGTDVYIRAAHR
jgi:quercetin dioxygenase-like cupin family protein